MIEQIAAAIARIAEGTLSGRIVTLVVSADQVGYATGYAGVRLDRAYESCFVTEIGDLFRECDLIVTSDAVVIERCLIARFPCEVI